MEQPSVIFTSLLSGWVNVISAHSSIANGSGLGYIGALVVSSVGRLAFPGGEWIYLITRRF